MKIVPVKQGTEEWLKARAGIPTASEFDALVTPEWKVRTGAGPEGYMYRKLAEKLTGMPLQQSGGWATDQGSILENEALPWFMFDQGVQVDRVGLVTTDDGRVGCSPDGLIGEDGGIEAKCPQPEAHLRYFCHGGVPKEYLAQVHGAMYVTGRKWWWFLSYSHQFPSFMVRVERDEKIIAAIKDAIDRFYFAFDLAYNKLKGLRDAQMAAKGAAYAAETAKMRAESPTGELPGEKWLRETGKKL